jgi:hypothetical protein
MRHTSRRRSAPDPLAPVNAPTWLVVRNGVGFVLEATELTPGADLRSVLTAAREARIADGWEAQEIGASCAFFFAVRDGVRFMIAIERWLARAPILLRETSGRNSRLPAGR